MFKFKRILKDIFYYPIVCFPSNFIRLMKWVPTIWKDRDFDSSYMFIVLKKKLESMYKFFNSDYPMCEGAAERAKEIKDTIDCINYIIEDKAIDEAFRPLREKYPEKTHYSEEVEIGGQKFYQYKSVDEELSDKCCVEVERLQTENDEKLFKLLKEHYAGWWD